MTPIIFYGTEDDTIATRTRMAKVQLLNEPVASGTAPIASSCPFSVIKKGTPLYKKAKEFMA